jgi:hypothetical protein
MIDELINYNQKGLMLAKRPNRPPRATWCASPRFQYIEQTTWRDNDNVQRGCFR